MSGGHWVGLGIVFLFAMLMLGAMVAMVMSDIRKQKRKMRDDRRL